MNQRQTGELQDSINSLQKETWETVNKNYIRKSIAELLHEQLITPHKTSESEHGVDFILHTDKSTVQYKFSGAHRAMDHWHVYTDSIVKMVEGIEEPANDAMAFFLDIQKILGVEPFTFTHFIEESYNTLYADAFLHQKGRYPASVLAELDSQTIEHHMDGHPWATVNKGRIGFDQEDYHRYAPEADQPVQLWWLAAHRSRATFNSIASLDFPLVANNELGKEKVDNFNSLLSEKGLDPEDYYLIPIHEWQWNNKLAFYFAGDIANHLLVPLGLGDDRYSPQQSIRTFYNLDNPDRFYVKTSISILNTSIFRGLPPEKLKVAPFITNWILSMLDGDSYLAQHRFLLLGEVASITYEHPHFSAIPDGPYQYKEMLGVIWRESAAPHLENEEKMMTMAALMYVDNNGNSLIGALIEKSGLTKEEWLKKYLKAYLSPLLHCFYRYGLCFSPHGENTILVLKDNIPQRVIVKDFVEEIHLNEEAYEASPEEVKRVRHPIENQYVPLFILSGIFDGVFRYISNVLVTYDGMEESTFWEMVHETISEYQQQFPEQDKLYQQFDLYTPEFIRVCINRVRLLTYGYKEATDIPEPAPHGTLINPITVFKK